MIERLVGAALRARFLVFVAMVLLIGGGVQAHRGLDIEAYPNPVPPMIDVITTPGGWSAEEVERYVTIPLEVAFSGMPGLEHTRSQSLFGLSDVKCYFRWGTSYKDARQEVLNRIALAQLPGGLQPQLSPWNAIGEMVRYTVQGDASLMDRKTAQDWIIEPQLRRAPGVIDVSGFGGETKQLQIGVDPFRLQGHHIGLDDLVTSVQNANRNSGGQRLTLGQQSYAVRGVGLLHGTEDLKQVVVGEQKNVPTRLEDVADVKVGPAPRLGIVGQDDQDEVVQGTVLMAYEGHTKPTLEAIHEKLDRIKRLRLLPPGMTIVPYYDRGDLVAITTHTVTENVLLGIALVTAVLLLFLGHARAALVTAANIPLALLASFIGIVLTGTSANLISLGAVDFGIVVDSTVIMMESIFSQLGHHGQGTMSDRVKAGARAVGRPMLFSTLILAVAFLPLFTMQGVAGVIFSPLAVTYAFAIGSAVVLAMTLTPVLARTLISARDEEKDSFATRLAAAAYAPLFERALRWPRRTVAVCLAAVGLALAAGLTLGGEFMPKLEEGNLWIRIQLPGSISLEQSARYVGRMRRIVRGCPVDPEAACTDQNRLYPEVRTVVSQLGRPDDGIDTAGFGNVELFAPLTAPDTWPRGFSKERMIDEMSRRFTEEFPGVTVNFSQAIRDNVEEALSGVKGENSIKVAGPDVVANERTAEDIARAIGEVRGVRDVGIFRSLEQPTVKIEPDRTACARYGLNSGDVVNVIQAAIGGQAVSQVYEGEKRFDIVLRWLEPYRSSLDAIREIAVVTRDGSTVPLGQLATIEVGQGPSVIYREDGQRFSAVKFSVRGRDLAGAIDEAQARVAHDVKLPLNTNLEWDGEMNELRSATARLKLVVPLTLGLVVVLVYLAVERWLDLAAVLLNLPVGIAGGILALVVTGTPFSVSAAMGFVSILGIAVQDAMLVVTYFRRQRDEGVDRLTAAREAAHRRLRPSLMTTLVAMIGLLPAALSHGIGSETQKPLAVVVIGGCLLLAVIARVLQPPVLVLLDRLGRGHPLPRPDLPAPDADAHG